MGEQGPGRGMRPRPPYRSWGFASSVLSDTIGTYLPAWLHGSCCPAYHEEGGHPLGQSTGFVNLGELYPTLGDYAEAETCLQQALSINRNVRARQREALVLSYRSLLVHNQGEDETARECGQQALALAQEAGDRVRQGVAWMMLGHALLGLGQLAEATEAHQESVALWRELDQSNLAMEPPAGLARVALAQDDLVQAQAHVEEILVHLESGGTRSTDTGHALDGTVCPVQVYLTCYHVLDASQDRRD
jgi:tetratricopeptide (TPR) repeat protein